MGTIDKSDQCMTSFLSNDTATGDSLGEVFFDTSASSSVLAAELEPLLRATIKLIQAYGRERSHLHEILK